MINHILICSGNLHAEESHRNMMNEWWDFKSPSQTSKKAQVYKLQCCYLHMHLLHALNYKHGTNNHRTLTKPSSGAWSRRRNQVAGKPKKDAARQCIAASCSRPYWRLEIFFRVNFGDTVHKLIYIQYGHALWIILQRRPTDVQRRRLSNLFQMGMCFQLKPNVHK